MAEVATNPQAGVEAPSVEQRLVAFYTKGAGKPEAKPEPTPPAPEAAPANAEADSPEETDLAETDAPDDDGIVYDDPEPEAAPQSAETEFEIVHNGQQHKLSRAETIELAQKGFDYTQKSQAVAAKEAQISEALLAAQQVAQMQVALAPEIAQVEGFRSVVKEYDGVNWITVQQQDALNGTNLYAVHRARYEQHRDWLQQSEQALDQKFRVVHQGQEKAQAALVESERARLSEIMPWGNDKKRQAVEFKATIEAAMADGYPAEELANIPQARYVRTLWKAKEYDRLMATRGGKLKQMREAPPMAKPGAANPAPSQGAQQYQKLRAQFKKTGDWRDMAALVAMQEKAKRK